MAISDESKPAALPYLRPQALAFLRNLKRHNDRDWFQPRKAQFETKLKEPMLAIIRKVTEAMTGFAPEFVRPAEKCLFRIYRDSRFSSDTRPYKTHVAAWWSHQGLKKTSGAGYYFHVSAQEVVIAAGCYMPEKEHLAEIRHWLLEHHAEFRGLMAKASVRKAFQEFEGNALTRAPKGFPAEHPAMDLIRCRQWGLSATLPASAALEKNFAATIVRYFRIATPIVDALNEPIATAHAAGRRASLRLNSIL